MLYTLAKHSWRKCDCGKCKYWFMWNPLIQDIWDGLYLVEPKNGSIF